MNQPITQTFENITQSGTEQTISGSIHDIGITSTQFYSVLFAFTVVLIFFLTFIYLLIKTFINKSCVGCKRLIKCEKEIKEIKTNLEVGKYLDFDVFQDISNKLDDIKEDLTNG